MAYDEYLAERVQRVLHEKKVAFIVKKMMGGLCYMVDDKMCIGVIQSMLMARVGPDRYEELLGQPGARQMDFTGRPMKGYVFVGDEGIDSDADLARWIQYALNFNPEAKSSKKRKKKKA